MDEISEFKSQRSYSDRKMWVEETIKHPAKAHLGMLEAIILEYTNEGDTILDPMAGIGSTLLLGMLHNRNVIGIEYEEKFCKIIRANIELNRKRQRLLPLGHAEIIQGDAKLLSSMFKGGAGSVVFSPPYSESLTKKRKGHTHIDSLKKTRQMTDTQDDNIANLPHGDIDSVICSPPYAGTISTAKPFSGWTEEAKRKWWETYKSQTGGMSFEQFVKYQTEKEYTYSDDKANIGNLPFKADSIITSPPYSSDMSHGEGPHAVKLMQYIKEKEGRWPVDNEIFRRYSNEWQRNPPEGRYSDDKANIGNLKGQTYLEAMKMVYQGCYAVLRENGTMVLITKNFIRNKKIVPLDQHTIKLCESIGFKFVKRHYRKITRPSFWRRLYAQKYGISVPYEDILVFRK